MSNNIIPIFTTDATIGSSILCSDEASEIKDNSPVSIFSIGKSYDINPIYILENSFISFITCYRNANKIDKQLIFGIQFKLVQNSKLQSEDSFLSEQSVCIWIRNSEGYKDLIKLYSAIHSDKTNFYYYPRGDWNIVQNYWTDNLLMTIPFYSSFLARNLLEYSHQAIPHFGKIKPLFHIEDHDLPFDFIIKNGILDYIRQNNYGIINSHKIYFYKNSDIFPMQIMKCINKRTTFEQPDLNHFSSNKFSFETFLLKNGKKII